MIYTIQYESAKNGYCDGFVMEGWSAQFIGDHLKTIAQKHDITYNCLSESHMLAVLESKGIIVNLLEEDGSRMDW